MAEIKKVRGENRDNEIPDTSVETQTNVAATIGGIAGAAISVGSQAVSTAINQTQVQARQNQLPNPTGINWADPSLKKFSTPNDIRLETAVENSFEPSPTDGLSLFRRDLSSEQLKRAVRSATTGIVPAEYSSDGERKLLTTDQTLQFKRQFNNSTQNALDYAKATGYTLDIPPALGTLDAAITSFKLAYGGYKQGIRDFNEATGVSTEDESYESYKYNKFQEEYSSSINQYSGWITAPPQVVGSIAALGVNAVIQDKARIATHIVPALFTGGRSAAYTIKGAALYDIIRSTAGQTYADARDLALQYGASETEAHEIAYELMTSYGYLGGIIESGGTYVGLKFLGKAISKSPIPFGSNLVASRNAIASKVSSAVAKRGIQVGGAISFSGEEIVTEISQAILMERVFQIAAERAGGEYTPDYFGAAEEAAIFTFQGTAPIGVLGAGVGTFRSYRARNQNIRNNVQNLNNKIKNTSENIVDSVDSNKKFIGESRESVELTKQFINEQTEQLPSPLINMRIIQQYIDDSSPQDNTYNPNSKNEITDLFEISENEYQNAIDNNLSLPMPWDSFIDLSLSNPELARQIARNTEVVPQSIVDQLDLQIQTQEQIDALNQEYINAVYNTLKGLGIDDSDAIANASLLNSLVETVEIRTNGLITRPQLLDKLEFEFNGLDEKGRRGLLSIKENSNIISIFEGYDASTIPHEIAHYMRRVLNDAAVLSRDEIITEDVRTINRFVKAEDGKPWTQAQEEKFAKAFERYLAEGRAPNKKLSTVFEYFHNAIVQIYNRLTGIGKINNSVRAVFDRMLNNEVESQQYKQQLRGIIFPEGTSDSMINVFNDLTIESRNEINRQVIEQNNLDIELELPDFDSISRNQIQNDSRRILLESIIDDGGLNRMLMEQQYGIEFTNRLDQNHPNLISESGRAFDEVAESRNLNWEDMIRDIDSLLPIEEEVVARSIALEAEYMNDNPIIYAPSDADVNRSSILVEALDNGQSLIEFEKYRYNYEQSLEERTPDGMQTEFDQTRAEIAIKEKQLSELAQQRIPNLNQISDTLKQDETLQEVIDRELVSVEGELTPEERRSYQESVKNTLKIDDIQKRLQKRIDILTEQKNQKTLQLAKEVRDGKARLKALGERLKFIHKTESKAKKIMKYNDQISSDILGHLKNLIIDTGLSQSKSYAPIQSPFNALLNELENSGFDISVPEWIIERDFPRRADGSYMNYKQWSIGELRDLKGAIDNLEHIGKEIKKLENSKYKENIQNKLNTITKNTERVFSKKGYKDTSELARQRELPFFNKISDVIASTIKTEAALRVLDGTTDADAINGPAYKAIYEPISKAYDAELSLKTEVFGKIREAFEKLPEDQRKKWQASTFSKAADIGKSVGIRSLDSWGTTRYNIEGTPYPLTREQMIMVALNSGNKGNIDALIDGNKFTEDGIRNIFNELTPEEIQLIQSLWDTVDSLFPRLAEVVNRTTGQTLEKVLPMPIETKIGLIRGGYFPLIFDKGARNGITDELLKRSDSVKNLLAAGGYKASTKSAASNVRTGAKYPVLLNMGVLDSHVNDVIHDITHREPVRDVRRIINSPEFKNTVDKTLGKSYYNHVFKDWIEWNARPRYQNTSAIDNFIDILRKNVSIATMGYKFSVSVMQLSGLAQSADTVGGKWIASGLADKLSDFNGERAKWIDSVSPVMKERRRGIPIERDFQDVIGDYQNIMPKSLFKTFSDSAFKLISKMDLLVADSTFLGAYEKAINEGKNKSEAIEIADHAVRTTQPLNAPKDSAAIQHGSSLARLLTMYYTFFSGVHNRLWLRTKQAQTGVVSFPQVLSTAFWTLVIPAFFDFLVYSRRLPEDEDDLKAIAGNVISYGTSGLPIVRDIVNSVSSGYTYRTTPAVSGLESFARAGQRITSRQEVDEKALLDIFRGTGTILGIPATQQLAASFRGYNESFDIDDPSTYLSILLGPPQD